MAEEDLDDDERRRIRDDFADAVNMAPQELEEWLETAESQEVGWSRDGDDESVGHESGRRIVDIKRKQQAELEDEDYAHMKKVIGYVNRHLAQGGPSEDVESSRWRYSLKNWGHDPARQSG